MPDADAIAAHDATRAASTIPIAAAPLPVKTDHGKDWSRALVIAGGAGPDSGETRPVIVCEARGDDGSLNKTASYGPGADIYFRSGNTDDSAKFADGTHVVTMGVDVEQGMLHGFSGVQGIVHAGPAHPAFAAANLAYLHGAKDIEVRGLSDFWKARLQPWFDGIATDTVAPAPVKVTLT